MKRFRSNSIKMLYFQEKIKLANFWNISESNNIEKKKKKAFFGGFFYKITEHYAKNNRIDEIFR